jgi:hypothetical protein
LWIRAVLRGFLELVAVVRDGLVAAEIVASMGSACVEPDDAESGRLSHASAGAASEMLEEVALGDGGGVLSISAADRSIDSCELSGGAPRLSEIFEAKLVDGATRSGGTAGFAAPGALSSAMFPA